MKSLIIGARGLVGSALKRQLPNAIEGIPVEPKKNTNQVYIDITKYETLFKAFSNHRPDVVYLAASMANVEQCEDSKGTDVVNVAGAITTLRLCEMFNAKLVYFSSSYVFDGNKKDPYTELDEPCPINYYGEQKRLVEQAIQKSEAEYLILRTVGVFGTERLKKNFAKQVIDAIFHGRKVFAPNDQFMNPILSDQLAKISIQLAEKKKGLFHVAGDTCFTKYDFARKIAFYFGLDELVVPVTTDEMHQKAKRPRNGCLDCHHLESIGIQIPSFDAGMLRFLTQEYNG